MGIFSKSINNNHNCGVSLRKGQPDNEIHSDFIPYKVKVSARVEETLLAVGWSTWFTGKPNKQQQSD